MPRFHLISVMCILGPLLWGGIPCLSQERKPDTSALIRQAQSEDLPEDKRLDALLELSAYFYQEDVEQLKKYSLDAYNLAEQIGDSARKGVAARMHGVAHALQGNMTEAAAWTSRSVKLARKYDTEANYINSLVNITGIIFNLREWSTCLRYARSLLQQSMSIRDTMRMAVANEVLGLTHLQMGHSDSAVQFFTTGIRLYKSQEQERAMANCMSSLGTAFASQNEYGKALRQIEKANAIFDRLDGSTFSSQYIASQLEEVDMFLKLGLYDRAGNRLEDLIPHAKAQHLLTYLNRAYRQFSVVDSANGHFERAFSWLRKHKDLNDSLTSAAAQNETTKILANFEDQQRETQIQLLNTEKDLAEARYTNQRTILISVIAALFILITLTGELIRRNHVINRVNRELAAKKELIQKKSERLEEYGRQLEKQKEELETLNHTKDRWFGIVSHDFRHPLVVLGGALDIIEDDDLKPEERTMLIQDLKVRFNQTSSLLDNLLFWAQHQLDGWKAHVTTLRLSDLLAPVVDIAQGWADEKDIRLTAMVKKDFDVQTDVDAVRMVVRNLINNAIKYSYSGQEVRLWAQKATDHWSIDVQDEGIGLEEKELNAIICGDKKSVPGTNKEKGSGLGLSLSQDFARFLGGELTVSSVPGQGTTFRLSIPLSPENTLITSQTTKDEISRDLTISGPKNQS